MTDTPTPSIEEVKERLLARDVVRRGKTVLLDIGDGPKPVSTGDVVRFRNPDGPTAHATITALQSELERRDEAIRNLLDTMASTYTARNGRQVGIQGDDGEKCWIVHSDAITELEATLKDRPNTAKDG